MHYKQWAKINPAHLKPLDSLLMILFIVEVSFHTEMENFFIFMWDDFIWKFSQVFKKEGDI